MFAHSHQGTAAQQWNTSHLLHRSKITEDIYVISEAFESFERKSLIRHSPNTAKDFRQLAKSADKALQTSQDLNGDGASGEDIHLFLSRLWRMTFAASRDWLRLYDTLDLSQAYQKTMTVLTLSVLAPLKTYRSVLESLPNLLFALRILEECSRGFKTHTGYSWMNWQADLPAAIITALCETLNVQVVERWIHQHLTPITHLEDIIYEPAVFWAHFNRTHNKLYAKQHTWHEIFPDTEITIDVCHS